MLPVVGLLAVQAYLVFREPIFSPVDELQHTDYVRTIAEEDRLPIYGQARIDTTLLAVYMHEYPKPFELAGYRLPDYIFLDYEALQFPAYYIVAAPLYRLFDWDPRVAIYALRIENAIFSSALLLVLILILRRVFPGRQEVAGLAPLVFLAMPGLSLRHSQVTNEVLAALLLAVLFALLVQKGTANPARLALAEGALFGVALMTKITVVGVGPSVLAAWATRTGGLRPRLVPGAIGFAITIAPWLVWSLVVYHFPLPWATVHLTLSFCPCPAPATAARWLQFSHDLLTNFVLPFEWAGTGLTCNPTCTELSPRTNPMRLALAVVAVVSAAALVWGLLALRNRSAAVWRPALLAMLAIAGVVVGVFGLQFSLDRFVSTDLREIYVFAAPVVLVLGGLAASLNRNWTVLVIAAVLVLWLLIDYQMYSMAACPGCPPNLFSRSP